MPLIFDNLVLNYKVWNNALLDYFFPCGEEDPILYLDANILAEAAQKAGIKEIEGSSYEEMFLTATLLSPEYIKQFNQDWYKVKCDTLKATSWNQLVEKLQKEKLDEKPASFAILCAIMYVASSVGAKHDDINNMASKYLITKGSKRPGELVEPLLTCLTPKYQFFDADHMICGKDRHVSRIKYHLVLKKRRRDDFISFIEVNNLQWGTEPYSDFVNNKLIPAMANAGGMRDLIEILVKPENIPYIKNILSTPHNYGKKTDGTPIVQNKPLRWHYELHFDFDGTFSFLAISDYLFPFAVTFNKSSSEFVQGSTTASSSDLLGKFDYLLQIKDSTVKTENEIYNITNIGQSTGGVDRYYFEVIGADDFKQVEYPIDGRTYFVFISKAVKNKKPYEKEWPLVQKDEINIPGFDIYYVESFNAECRVAKTSIVKDRLKDEYQLYGFGSWYSIFLKEGDCIMWKEKRLGASFVPITDTLLGKDGKHYFIIPSSGKGLLIGDILIKNKNNEVWSDHISSQRLWEGFTSIYSMNGWGETICQPIQLKSLSRTLRKGIIPDGKGLEGSEILMQCMFVLADKDGCVTTERAKAAIDFAMSFFGIQSTNENRKSLLYALRRLGYIVEYYDTNKSQYVHQLVPKYLEKSELIGNPYILKGAYSSNDLEALQSSALRLTRRRPYQNSVIDSTPEYQCLPDTITVSFRDKPEGWTILESPVSYQILSEMNGMKDFPNYFGISSGGDLYMGTRTDESPCMVLDSNGKEVLCTKARGSLLTHRFYTANNQLRLIPKHTARIYTQNEKERPVCLMNWVAKQLDYSKIYFVSGMGIPEPVGVALTDSNIGLPKEDLVFIVDQKEALGIRSERQVIERRTFNTNAYTGNNKELVDMLEKLSNRKISASMDSSAVCIVREGLQGYSMYLKRDYRFHKDLLCLYYGEELLAFSIGRNVYYKEHKESNYMEVTGDTVNSKLSDVLKLHTTISQGGTFTGVVPSWDSSFKKVTIIERK